MAENALAEIKALGRELERAWAARDFDPDAFIALSTAALERAGLPGRVSGSELLAQVAGRAELPPEQAQDSRVVDEQITLFRCPRFVIQLLVWIDGITDIHDHRLSGAYLALEGERIEAHYRFALEQELDDSVRVGTLAFDGMERVRAGRVLPFTPGAQALHAVFHLHHPSVTLAIRAPRLDVDAGFNYLRPGLATRTKISPRVRQRIQALHTMRAADYAAYAPALERALLDAEPLELFYLLNEHRTAYVQRLPELRALLSRLEERHGRWVRALARAFAERTRMIVVRAARQSEHDPSVRLALAMVLHAQSLDDLEGARAPEVLAALDLIAERIAPLRADVQRLKVSVPRTG